MSGGELVGFIVLEKLCRGKICGAWIFPSFRRLHLFHERIHIPAHKNTFLRALKDREYLLLRPPSPLGSMYTVCVWKGTRVVTVSSCNVYSPSMCTQDNYVCCVYSYSHRRVRAIAFLFLRALCLILSSLFLNRTRASGGLWCLKAHALFSVQFEKYFFIIICKKKMF